MSVSGASDEFRALLDGARGGRPEAPASQRFDGVSLRHAAHAL